MRYYIYFLFLTAALLFFCALGHSQEQGFSTYTFKFDPTLKIGFPTGWSVQEEMDDTKTVVSAAITRTGAADSEGFIFFLIPYPKDTAIKDSKQFAGIAIEHLRTNALPGLTLVKEYQHQGLQPVHVSELSLDSGGIDFLGRSWSAFLRGDGTVAGVFALFYGPRSTFGNFNADRMLAGMLTPLFGANTGSSQAPAPAGSLDSRFFGTWALHTTVAADTMMQENTYNPDGTFVIRQFASGTMMSTSPYSSGSASQTLHGTWGVRDGLFYLRWQNGGEALYRFNFSGGFVEMQGVNVKENLKFRKVR